MWHYPCTVETTVQGVTLMDIKKRFSSRSTFHATSYDQTRKYRINSDTRSSNDI